MLKLGVIGAGHLGKIHIKLAKQVEAFELIGFFDVDPEVARAVEEQFGVKAYSDVDELIREVDAVDIVTPTLAHFDYAAKALRASKHVFIEKPVTQTVDEARSLMRLAEEANVTVQVGHVERFNPAFKQVAHELKSPKFIETHRLAEFNPRGTDVPVVMDLMIHDIDIVLSVVQSNIKHIHASGVAVVSDTPDIANARIEFDNGCVANLTSSRISLKNMRKSRFFQKDAYITVDFLEKQAEIIKMKDVQGEADPFAMVLDLGDKGQREIQFMKPKPEESNAIQEELTSFAQAIQEKTTPVVSLQDGMLALEVAAQIVDKLKSRPNFVLDAQ